MKSPEGDGRPAGDTWPGPTEDLVEQLVAACLEQRDGRGSQRLESILRDHPDLAEEVRATLAVVDRLGVDRALVLPGPGCQVGEFRIDGRLGGGAMGVVYAAVHMTTGQAVALKMVRPEFVLADRVRARFEREVAAIRRLHHPAVVKVHGWGEVDGAAFLVMERVEGCTLAELLEQLRARDPARLSGADLRRAVCERVGVAQHTGAGHELFAGTWEQTCLRIARQLGRALDHTHRAGVMHRDVKPSNVMITPEGRVLLIDFGLARPVEGARMTNSGSAVGSELYMAPEIHRGETSGGVATDIYALGVTLYELLTLKHPFDGETLQATRRAIVAGRCPDLPAHVSEPGAIVCRHAMDVLPGRRYVSASHFARDLTAALSGRSLRSWRPGSRRRVLAWLRQHDVSLASAAALLVAIVGLGLAVASFDSARVHRQRADRFERLALAAQPDASTDALDGVVPAPVQLALAQVELPEIAPFMPPIEQDPLALAQALMDRAREAMQEGDLTTALERARLAVALHRENPGNPSAFIESLLLLAELRRAAGDLAGALALEVEAQQVASALGRRTLPPLAAAVASQTRQLHGGLLGLPGGPLTAPATAAHDVAIEPEPDTEGAANLGVHHVDLGFELHGNTQMRLLTSGGATTDESVHVVLSGAQSEQVTVLVIGWSAGYHPLHFGVLVPDPDVLMPLIADGMGGGQWELAPDWLVNNMDFPSVWLQFLAKDEGTPFGWGFSNAMRIDAH